MGASGQYTKHEKETLQRGCFPTSSKRLLKADQTFSFTILDYGVLKTLGLSEYGGIERITNVSWALLLRRYLRTNCVSFRLLRNREDDATRSIHYRLSDHDRLDDTCEVHEERGQSDVGYSHVDINTAIRQTTKKRPIDHEEGERQQLQIEDPSQVCSFSTYNVLFFPDILV